VYRDGPGSDYRSYPQRNRSLPGPRPEVEYSALKRLADRDHPEIRLQPEDFPFARSSRPGWTDRLPPSWAFALAFLIWMIALSGTYFLEPSLTP